MYRMITEKPLGISNVKGITEKVKTYHATYSISQL